MGDSGETANIMTIFSELVVIVCGLAVGYWLLVLAWAVFGTPV